MVRQLQVGVLACQGAFAEHVMALKRLDLAEELKCLEVRSQKDLTPELKGLIIPGGESTTLNRFLREDDFVADLKLWMNPTQGNRPVVWGTCAGLILLSNCLADSQRVEEIQIGGLHVTTQRNHYGRQSRSFEQTVYLIDDILKTESDSRDFPGIFIRAPAIASIDDPRVRVLAELQHSGGVWPVGVMQDNLMATTFHPELTRDLRFHAFFIRQVRSSLTDP